MKGSLKENSSTRVVIICGPTGSGKSSLALNLAEKYGGRIIGADSRQIYRRLDIGTAKPSKDDQARIPHYMIDIVEVTETFTAKKYAELAINAINETVAAGAIPFVVGGAGLYLEALTAGLFECPVRNPLIRNELEIQAKNEGLESLHGELSAIDPVSAELISPHDHVRLVRALEIYRLTGKRLSQLKLEGEYKRLNASYLWIGINYNRDKLYERINLRVDQMIENGLIEEINGLLRDGLGDPIIEKGIVGYAEIIGAIQNKMKMEEAILLIKQRSRNYAKRQLTWFRNKAPVKWISLDSSTSSETIHNLIESHLTKELDT